MAASGGWLAASSAGLGGRALGLCIIGCGPNYAPLAVPAIALGRPGALDGELADVDIGREQRHYSVLQLGSWCPYRSWFPPSRGVSKERAPTARLADVAWHGLFHVPGGVSAGVTQN